MDSQQIYNALGNPITPERLEEAYSNGLIKKEDLQHGVAYCGYCRNASIAVWDSNRSRFVHLRTKFHSTFCEDIVHPVDDHGFDIFTPVEVDPGGFRLPLDKLRPHYDRLNEAVKARKFYADMCDKLNVEEPAYKLFKLVSDTFFGSQPEKVHEAIEQIELSEDEVVKFLYDESDTSI